MSFFENKNTGLQERFILIYKKYYRKLCMQAFKYVKDVSIAEDVVQDVIYRIWEKDQLHTIDNIENYLYKAVINESINKYKQQIRFRSKNEEITGKIEEKAAINYDFYLFEEIEVKVEIAIGKLPERTRDIFKMNRFEGLTYHEISQKLNISDKGVEFHMSNALRDLREHLKEFL